MRQLVHTFLLILWVFPLAPAAAVPAGPGTAGTVRSAEADALTALLPRTFVGFFRWRQGGGLQSWTIRAETVFVNEQGMLEVLGSGKNVAGEMETSVDVRMLVDPQSLHVTIWESNPRGDGIAFYVTDGRYEGRLSTDLYRLDAVWVGNDKSSGVGDLLMFGAVTQSSAI